MSDQPAPTDDTYLHDLYGPCAIGAYQRGEQITYHDGEVKQGTILWLHTGRRGIVYVVSDGTYDCIYVPEEKVIGIVHEVRELSPVV